MPSCKLKAVSNIENLRGFSQYLQKCPSCLIMFEHHKFRNSKCNKNITDHLPATLVSELSKTSISSEELLLSTGTYHVLADILHTKKLRVAANGQHVEIGPDLSHNFNGALILPCLSSASGVDRSIDKPNLHSILFHYPCFACFVYISPFPSNFPLGSQKDRENGEGVEKGYNLYFRKFLKKCSGDE